MKTKRTNPRKTKRLVKEGTFSRNIECFDTNCEVLSLTEDEYDDVHFKYEPHSPSKYSWISNEFPNLYYNERCVLEMDIGLDEDESEVAAFVSILNGDGEFLVGLITRKNTDDYSDEEVAELVKRAERKADKVLSEIAGQSVAKPDKFEDYWTGLKKLPRRKVDENQKITLTLGQLKRLVKESEENGNPGYEILSIDKTDLMSQSLSGESYYYDVIVSVNGKKRRIPIQAKNDEDARRKAESRIEIGYKMGELEDWGFPVKESRRRVVREGFTPSKGLTVQQLYRELGKMIQAGNGDKYVLISSDDECNEYHSVFSGVVEYSPDDITDMQSYGTIPQYFRPDEVVTIS